MNTNIPQNVKQDVFCLDESGRKKCKVLANEDLLTCIINIIETTEEYCFIVTPSYGQY